MSVIPKVITAEFFRRNLTGRIRCVITGTKMDTYIMMLFQEI